MDIMQTEKLIEQGSMHQSMRGLFSGHLHNSMLRHPDIILITADLGWGIFDRIKEDCPKQFYNVGASECAGLDICVGLALSGKIPVFYSITPFAIFRAFETIRNYIDREQISVKICGSGRDRDYLHDGVSHWADDVKPHLDLFPNIIQYWPKEKEDIEETVKYMLFNDKPSFLSLRR